MVRRMPRPRPTALRALFVFIATAVVAVFGMSPAGAAPLRQLASTGDTTASTPSDAAAGSSVSIAVPEDADQAGQPPVPAAAPAPVRPPLPAAHTALVALPANKIDSLAPSTARGRGPPR